MTNDDKQFFTGLFDDLKQTQGKDRKFFTGLFDDLKQTQGKDRQFFTGLFDDLKQTQGKDRQFFTGLFDDLRELIQKNSDEIRHNGVLIEQNADNIQILSEGQGMMSQKIGKISEDVEIIKDNISDLPAIRAVVKAHSKKLAAI